MSAGIRWQAKVRGRQMAGATSILLTATLLCGCDGSDGSPTTDPAAAAVCGNGLCEVGEGPAVCPADCGSSGGGTDAGAAQPDATEDPVDSDAENRSADVGTSQQPCGDGACNAFETCADCPEDCGPCGPACGDGTCNVLETCADCPQDCGTCDPFCGDGSCNGSESCASCPLDCGSCPCSQSDESCAGDVLTYCSESGALQTLTCSKELCLEAGFVGYVECGDYGGGKNCICQGCEEEDEGCLGGAALVCDSQTGKLTKTPCGEGQKCYQGACVDKCEHECSVGQCVDGQLVGCEVGTDGCYKKLAAKACTGGLVCLDGGTECGPCNDNADCAADEVCTLTCEWFSGKTFYFDFSLMSFPSTNPNGNAWDAIDGPDVKACVYKNCGEFCSASQLVGCTDVTYEATSPALLTGTVETKVYFGDKIAVLLYEHDNISDSEFMAGVEYNDTAGLLHKGYAFTEMGDADQYNVSFTVLPY